MALTVTAPVSAKESYAIAIVLFVAAVALHTTVLFESDIHVHAAWHWGTLYDLSYVLLGASGAMALTGVGVWVRFNR